MGYRRSKMEARVDGKVCDDILYFHKILNTK